MPRKLKRFVALARVSSREQEREGFSLDIQEDALRQYAERNDGEIIRLFRIAETASKKDERKSSKNCSSSPRPTLTGSTVFSSIKLIGRAGISLITSSWTGSNPNMAFGLSRFHSRPKTRLLAGCSGGCWRVWLAFIQNNNHSMFEKVLPVV